MWIIRVASSPRVTPSPSAVRPEALFLAIDAEGLARAVLLVDRHQNLIHVFLAKINCTPGSESSHYRIKSFLVSEELCTLFYRSPEI